MHWAPAPVLPVTPNLHAQDSKQVTSREPSYVASKLKTGSEVPAAPMRSFPFPLSPWPIVSLHTATPTCLVHLRPGQFLFPSVATRHRTVCMVQDVPRVTRSNRHARYKASVTWWVMTCCEEVRDSHVLAAGAKCGSAALSKGISPGTMLSQNGKTPMPAKGQLLSCTTAARTGRLCDREPSVKYDLKGLNNNPKQHAKPAVLLHDVPTTNSHHLMSK